MAQVASVSAKLVPALGGSALLLAVGCSATHEVPGADAGAPDAWRADAAALDEPDAFFATLPRCGSGPVRPPAGPPCLDGACGVLATARIDDPHFRNDRPSIAVDEAGSPVVLYTTAEGAYALYVARRGADGTFTSHPLPPATANAALAISSDGCAYAHLNDGAFGSGLYRIDGERGQQVHARRARSVGGGRLVMGPDGSLHAIGRDQDDGSGFLARWADGYAERDLPGSEGVFSLPGGLAVGADGVVHAAWQALGPDGTLRLQYLRGDGSPEAIAALGTGLLLWGPSVDVVAHDDGTVHVLYGAPDGAVALATRGASWSVQPLFEGASSGTCPPSPTEGTTCETHEVQWSVLGLVSTGDGRALGIAARSQRNAVQRASCMGWPGGPPRCTFSEIAHTSASALHAVRIEGTAVTTHEVAPTGGGRIGTVALGPDGHVHVVSYDLETAVQYVEIGPLE
jgi:hypothetical protein